MRKGEEFIWRITFYKGVIPGAITVPQGWDVARTFEISVTARARGIFFFTGQDEISEFRFGRDRRGKNLVVQKPDGTGTYVYSVESGYMKTLRMTINYQFGNDMVHQIRRRLISISRFKKCFLA